MYSVYILPDELEITDFLLPTCFKPEISDPYWEFTKKLLKRGNIQCVR